MDWLHIISSIVSGLSIPTIAGLIWKDVHDRVKANSEQSKQKQREEHQKMVREVLQEEISPLKEKVDRINKKLDKVGEGTLSSLRNDILKSYYQCVAKGYRNDYDYINVHDLYNAYRDLEGNSFVQDVMERFDDLPTKEEYLAQQEVGHRDG